MLVSHFHDNHDIYMFVLLLNVYDDYECVVHTSNDKCYNRGGWVFVYEGRRGVLVWLGLRAFLRRGWAVDIGNAVVECVAGSS
jgi:hypothetical protein